MGKMHRLIKNNSGFIIAMLLLLVCRSSIADWYHVPTGSMLPTIIQGDRIFVNKLAYQVQIPFTNIAIMELDQPKTGDIIVFESAAAENRLIKRVIGTPGDVVSMQANRLTINGQSMHYSEDDPTYVTEHLPSSDHSVRGIGEPGHRDSFSPVKVPEGYYLVLGDNRNNSADSRVYGFVPAHEIQGKANTVIVSFDPENYYKPRAARYLAPLI
ncbi:MAG: signal peptidase I [Aestuariibacter sp.]